MLDYKVNWLHHERVQICIRYLAITIYRFLSVTRSTLSNFFTDSQISVMKKFYIGVPSLNFNGCMRLLFVKSRK